MGTAVHLENVTHRYRESGGGAEVAAIRDLTLSVEAGEFLVVMGESGSGKSTLLHLIGAIDRPTRGSVLLGDQRISDLPEKRLTLVRRHQVGFIFQFFNLIPTLTVQENVEFPLRLAGVSRKEARGRSEEVLARVKLSARSTHYPNELSGGEMQRVSIARAIVHRPPILLADEPTGNLDSRTGETVLELLREIHEIDKPTIVMATHSERAASFGKRMIEMLDGRILGNGERHS